MLYKLIINDQFLKFIFLLIILISRCKRLLRSVDKTIGFTFNKHYIKKIKFH